MVRAFAPESHKFGFESCSNYSGGQDVCMYTILVTAPVSWDIGENSNIMEVRYRTVLNFRYVT